MQQEISGVTKPGINVCEMESCRKLAVGDFKRKGRYKTGWDNNMPVSLCQEHAIGMLRVKCRLVIIDSKLIIKTKTA